jgi:hypothetical protein
LASEITKFNVFEVTMYYKCVNYAIYFKNSVTVFISRSDIFILTEFYPSLNYRHNGYQYIRFLEQEKRKTQASISKYNRGRCTISGGEREGNDGDAGQ